VDYRKKYFAGHCFRAFDVGIVSTIKKSKMKASIERKIMRWVHLAGIMA